MKTTLLSPSRFLKHALPAARFLAAGLLAIGLGACATVPTGGSFPTEGVNYVGKSLGNAASVRITYSGTHLGAKNVYGGFDPNQTSTGNLVAVNDFVRNPHYSGGYSQRNAGTPEMYLNNQRLTSQQIYPNFPNYPNFSALNNGDGEAIDYLPSAVEYSPMNFRGSKRTGSDGKTILSVSSGGTMTVLGKKVTVTKVAEARNDANWSGQKIKAVTTAYISDEVPGRLVRYEDQTTYNGRIQKRTVLQINSAIVKQ